MNRPERRNALSFEHIEELIDALENIAKGDARVVILAANGPVFCAGHDYGDMVDRDLQGKGLSRERVLASAVRLIDLGFFRPGGEEYAAGNGSFGLATIRREHVTCRGGEVIFEYDGKSGRHREQSVAD